MEKETKAQTLDMREFEVFKVKFKDTETQYGYQIVAGDDNFLIFGLGSKGNTPEELERIKAFCEYWCLHLNQAFVSGYTYRDGFNSFQHTEGSWKRLDDLYQKAFGTHKNANIK